MKMDNRVRRLRPNNFALIIGAMKCGTTSLFRLLAQHPEIARAREKEPEFFSDEATLTRGMDWYLDLWDWDPAFHKIALEASTGYSKAPFLPGVAKRISEVENAKFRFIYIIRNPVDRIVSHVRHGLYEGWSGSLDEGIEDHVIDVTRYAAQIDQYLLHFPRASLFLLTLEEFREDPEPALRKICRFLGVAEDFQFDDLHALHNSGARYVAPPAFWAGLQLESIVCRVVPLRARHALRRTVTDMFGTKARLGRYEVTEEEKAYVLKRLAPDLERLRSVYGIDVDRLWRNPDYT